MKIFCFILAVLFFASAAVQFNDPDPMLWVALYGITGLIALFAAFDRYSPWAILIMIAVCVYEIFEKFTGLGPCMSGGMPNITSAMQAETPCIESVREFLGILISLAALIFFYVRVRRKQLVRVEETKPRF